MSTNGSLGKGHGVRIATVTSPHLVPLPPRFKVDVRKARLMALVLREFIQTRGNLAATMSRPCVYGVFSGRLGGLRPKEQLCVGCMRCTVEYPQVVQIRTHPGRAELADEFLSTAEAEAILYEAHRGRVPVRGAGYRGRFGGAGWDGMWLDMSEIVRPTRDGIHGREFISTSVDVGWVPKYLAFGEDGSLIGPAPRIVPIGLPFFFDAPPGGPQYLRDALLQAAAGLRTLAVFPAGAAEGPHVVPIVAGTDDPALPSIPDSQPMVAIDGWDASLFDDLRARLPDALIWVRVPAESDVLEPVAHGATVIHLRADYQGESDGRPLRDLIGDAHERLVRAGVREQVTLVGSGGLVSAEHVPKAIAVGLDAVGLDVAAWAALHCRLKRSPSGELELAGPDFPVDWGVQRLVNLAASWRDQLLEVLGAMGLREVRRLRGETGRVMFQSEVEAEAFSEIAGYAS